MNSAPLNGVVFNGGPLDAIQRSATFVEAVAQVTMSPRVWARALIGTAINVAADVVAGSRVNTRSVTNLIAAAELAFTIKNFTTAPQQWFVEAGVQADGSVQDRTEFREQAIWPQLVSVEIDARVLVRPTLAVSPQAALSIDSTKYIAVYAPVTFEPSVAVNTVPTTKTLVLGQASIQPTASISASESSRLYIRAQVAIVNQALVYVDSDINRQIPYDEDAVSERTISLGQDLRVVYVS